MRFIQKVMFFSCMTFGVSFLFSEVFDDEIIQKQRVYETAYWDILVDYAPLTPGHLLAVAKSRGKVYKRLEELPLEAFSDLYNVTEKIHRVFSECLHIEDYLIVEKNGHSAGQTIDQVHVHYLPIQSTKWNFISIFYKMLLKVLFGATPDRDLEKNVAQFRAYFEQIEKTAK